MQGTYKPDRGIGVAPGDRYATFFLKNGVTIKGGYAGNGALDPDERAIHLFWTILSGDLAGNDATVSNPLDLPNEPTRSDNSHRVVSVFNADATTVLDGFIIIAGRNHSVLGYGGHGGGMLCWGDDTNPTVVNCTFQRNSADSNQLRIQRERSQE